MTLPRARTRILNGGLGLIATSGRAVTIFGCCSGADAADMMKPVPFGNVDDLVQVFETGPAVKAAAYIWERTKLPFVFVPMPKTLVDAFISDVDLAGVTGTLGDDEDFVALSGTPTDNYEVVVKIIDGGTTGITGITYQVSLNGGDDFGDTTALGTGLTIAPDGTSITITLTTGKTVIADDELSFYTLPASESLLPVTLTRADESTSEVTVTGEPEDAYDVIFQIIAGGTVGTIGITYRYSLDGGETYTPVTQLGTDLDVDLIDDERGGTILSGVNVAFDDGETLDAGDVVSFKTTGPEWQASDAETALDNLRESSNKWAFAYFEGASSKATAGTIGTKLEAFADDPDGAKGTKALLSARDRGTRETLLSWRDRVAADYLTLASPRTDVGAGYALHVTCPITGRRNRRPMTWQVVVRLLQNAIDVDPGQVSLGPLDPDVTITDETNQRVEYDARFDPTLHDARFLTPRTWEDETGIFISRGNTFEAEGGDYNRIAYLDVVDEGARVQTAVERRLVEIGFFVNPSTKPNPGAIRPVDANRIEREIRTALEGAIGSMVSAITVQVDRTTPALQLDGTGKIIVYTEVEPKVYADDVQGTIRLKRSTSITTNNVA